MARAMRSRRCSFCTDSAWALKRTTAGKNIAFSVPLEAYAVQFDPVFQTRAQRHGFRTYLSGLLLPRDRSKTLTALVGAEPLVQAQAAEVQRLQFFPVRGRLGRRSGQCQALGAAGRRAGDGAIGHRRTGD